MNLIIVESPHKAKTIEHFLKGDYKVDASKGHIRDLPVSRLGINVKKDFEPEYLINPDKQNDIKRLKDAVAKADTVYLATDPDREGEAISWHLSEVLGLDDTKPIRIEFHEVSEKAVKNALANPRLIDKNLVDAQQARRVLDRIVGYSISPAASVRLSETLSAGRVQSVALKMVVDREREIQDFKPQEYWLVRAHLATNKGGKLKVLLQEKDGKKYRPATAEETEEVLNAVQNAPFIVKNVKKSVVKAHAPAPFTTSTMQQDGVQRLGLTSPQIMSVAQKLYEGVSTPNGQRALITYMRTDSVRVSPDAQKSAREFIAKTYGEDFVPAKPNFYKTKGEAQDAHEAIRPIDVRVTPESMQNVLDKNQYRLYKLIYDRFIASQMSEAKYNSVVIDISSSDYIFRTSGRTEVFAGYTAVYKESAKPTNDDEDGENGLLPAVENGEVLDLKKLEKEQKFTKPPVRYTEATLIKAMEVEGIGRPSTYATIMGKLSDKKRAYVSKEKNYLIPTDISYPLIDFLVKYFPDVMDLKFTRRMETALDDIGEGGRDWHKLIADFYKPFEKQVKNSKITDIICNKCGAPMEIRSGKFGKFGNYYACTNYPDCHNIVPVNEKVVIPTEYICEKCGGVMVEREGKFGKFLACSNYPKCKNTKPLSTDGEVKKPENEGVCPECGKPTRKMTSKTGKTFYGCTGYPDCKFMSWEKPVGDKCNECSGVIVEVDGKKQCSNKRCKTNN
ncbi:MAG: type I DNA topoisomerase [Clostridia bacterium]|nr:type I DNA topoisomerase [Clostridia bacterium]